jgi:hypothetical protein
VEKRLLIEILHGYDQATQITRNLLAQQYAGTELYIVHTSRHAHTVDRRPEGAPEINSASNAHIRVKKKA